MDFLLSLVVLLAAATFLAFLALAVAYHHLANTVAELELAVHALSLKVADLPPPGPVYGDLEDGLARTSHDGPGYR